MMREMSSMRQLLLFQCGATVLLVCGSFFLEYVFKLEPCVLCQLQRVIVTGLLVAGCAQYFTYDHVVLWRVSSSIFIVLLCLGLGLALRHVWLQHQPLSEVPIQCLPALSVMLDWLPWKTVIAKILAGDGLCHRVVFHFLGLSLPMWLTLVYTAMSGLLIAILLKSSSLARSF